MLCLCSLQLKRMMETDAAMTEDIAYNIIPLDTTSTTNAIVSFPEVDHPSPVTPKNSCIFVLMGFSKMSGTCSSISSEVLQKPTKIAWKFFFTINKER